MSGFTQGFVVAAAIVVIVCGAAWLFAFIETRRKEREGWTGRRR